MDLFDILSNPQFPEPKVGKTYREIVRDEPIRLSDESTNVLSPKSVQQDKKERFRAGRERLEPLTV